MLDSFFDPFEIDRTVTKDCYRIHTIPKKSADGLVKKYHYSGKSVFNTVYNLGLFRQGKLVGCLQYGHPMNGERTTDKFSSAVPCVELNRMVMDDEEPRNAESRAISMGNKWLKANTDVQYILSFSDGKQGNCGYIYQATNWLYLGYMISDSFYELDGEIWHNVSIWHNFKEKHPKRDEMTTNEIMGLYFDNISNIVSKQHIYVFPIRKKIKFNFKPKPYPKVDQEVPILVRKWIKKNGVDCKEIERYSDEKLEPVI